MDQKQSKSYALALLAAMSADDVEKIIKGNEDARYWFEDPQNWISYGGRAKNWDTVGNQQTNPVGALVELVTNGIDAILLRKARESGIEDFRSAKAPQSMFEAVRRFFPGIVEGKIANLEPVQRTKLAEQCMIIGVKRADRTNSRYPTYTLVDFGDGQKPEDFPSTFLSSSERKSRSPMADLVTTIQLKIVASPRERLRYCRLSRKAMYSFPKTTFI